MDIEKAPLTDAQREEIAQRHDATTAGPWWVEESERTWVLQGVGGIVPAQGNLGPQVVNHQILKAPKTGTDYAEYWPNEYDGAFIGNAWKDVKALRGDGAYLLDELGKARGQIADLEGDVAALRAQLEEERRELAEARAALEDERAERLTERADAAGGGINGELEADRRRHARTVRSVRDMLALEAGVHVGEIGDDLVFYLAQVLGRLKEAAALACSNERAEMIALLERAAAGRRTYADGYPKGEDPEGYRLLVDAVHQLESVVMLLRDPRHITALIPSWQWTDEEVRSLYPGRAGEETPPPRCR